MLSYLLRQLINSFGIFFRTIRALFTRKLVGVWSYLRRITNFSRHATRVATASFQGAAAAVKKPSKREDYIETERLFISKSFLILLAGGLVLLALLIYFVAWPFVLSRFLTARFYQGDERLDSWSGRVVVCYDREKDMPMYRGTLEDGLLQGKGEEYDENGLLVYAGEFSDGVRSGEGRLYEAGVLTYEGAFSGGLANGEGTAYQDGVKCYQGGFADGLYQGEGVAYHPNGQRAYAGSFAQGLYEGEGTEYDREGRVCYRGSFAQGLRSGSGTVYLENGDQIQGEFTDGEAGGAIQWYKGGRLWYDGGSQNLIPDGFGTLYAENGRAVYAGEFDRGTVDGAWLLGLTAGELREAFGEAAVSEADGSGGFLVKNETLGLTALCSYQQEGAQSQVYRLWFAPEAGSAWAALLPWENGEAAAAWALQSPGEAPQERTEQGAALRPDGTRGGAWYQRQYQYGEYVCILLGERAGEAPVQIYWGREMAQTGVPGTDPASAQAQARLEELLAALDGVGGGSEGGGQGGTADPEDVERLLGLMLTPQDGELLMDALIDCCVYSGMSAALEDSQPMLQQLLAEALSKLERGEGSQEEVDAAQGELDSLDRRLAQYRTAWEQANLTVEELCGMGAGDSELRAALLTFDPVTLDVNGLYQAALAYAQRLEEGQDTDAGALKREIQSAVLELGLSYESIRSARESAEQAAGRAEQTAEEYARGTADRAGLYHARCAQNEAEAALYQAAGAFARQANALNTRSGGWLAQEYGWLAETFEVLFRSEELRQEEKAPPPEEENAPQEETEQPEGGTAPPEGEEIPPEAPSPEEAH